VTAAIIFLALVVGFHACHIHPIHYYKLHRYAGQYLYLKSAELGARCFLIASIREPGRNQWQKQYQAQRLVRQTQGPSLAPTPLPGTGPKSATAATRLLTDQRLTRGRIKQLDCGIGYRRGCTLAPASYRTCGLSETRIYFPT